MSATAILETTGLPEAPKDCQILILCEDFAAYERAVEVCRRMMEQFAGELDFDFKCWNFIELADADCGRSAAKTAGTADIILLALHAMELPPVLDDWLARFPETRLRTDGALVLVWDGPRGSPATGEKLFTRLEQLAGQLGMDFVPLASARVASADLVFQAEECQMGALQSENLPYPPCDHWGLNE